VDNLGVTVVARQSVVIEDPAASAIYQITLVHRRRRAATAVRG
jgi:hypothetical protein